MMHPIYPLLGAAVFGIAVFVMVQIAVRRG